MKGGRGERKGKTIIGKQEKVADLVGSPRVGQQ